MRLRNIVVAVATTGTMLTVAPAAFAVGNGQHDPILGNVTGNAYSDRTTLGFDDTSCTISVERGLGHGRYATPVVHHYTIPGLPTTARCPDMGVAVSRRWSSLDDLVVTFFDEPPGVLNTTYVLRNFKLLTTSDESFAPSFVGSEDFNGDGRGDLWENSDQDGRFSVYLRQGRNFVPGAASFYTLESTPSLAFGHLDRTPGTDIAASYFSPNRDQDGLPAGTTAGSGALVVFGQTGAKVLLERDPDSIKRYTVAILDANCDGHQDVKVSDNTGAAPRIYLGDGRGHFHLAPAHH